MKRIIWFTNLVLAMLLVCLITACQSTAVAPSGAPAKETLLLQSGFRPFTVTTPKQQQRVSALPVGKVSTVGYKGKLYYVYPTATKGRILVGNQTQYRCLQTGASGIWSDDEPQFCGGHARAPSHSRSGIRWIRSPGRMMPRLECLRF